MRGRQVWPIAEEPIHDVKLVSLMRFWEPVSHLSIHELMHPSRWPEQNPLGLNIATVLDLLICRAQSVPQSVSRSSDELSTDVPMTAIDDEVPDENPTPWIDVVSKSSQNVVQTSPEECVVVFVHEMSDPIKISVNDGCTIEHLVKAQAQLVGGLMAIDARGQHGHHVPLSHVLMPGEWICVQCEEMPVTEVSPSSAPLDATGAFDCGADFDPIVSAFSPESQHVDATAPVDVQASEKPLLCESHFGPCDAGECSVPVERLPDCESWISAAPLLGLKEEQFKNLLVPAVTSTKHLWALRHQLLKAEDRVSILRQQKGVWSDDEFRFHISMLMQLQIERFSALPSFDFRKVFQLDPLLLTGWLHHGTHLCHEWGAAHTEIKTNGLMIISACVIEGHWIPVCLTPQGKFMHFTTWDAPQNSHEGLSKVVHAIALALGFDSVVTLRHQRLFLATDKCGALAMSFLHHCVFDTMLPTTNDEVEVIHEGYRDAYMGAVASAQLARRPWVWGSGDAEEIFYNEPGAASSDLGQGPATVDAGMSFSHQCIDKEARLALLREKESNGAMMRYDFI